MAAWFATNDTDPENDQVARIYAVRLTGKLTTEAEKVNPFTKEGEPRFIISPHWHPRVRAQRGCFSIHPVPNKAWNISTIILTSHRMSGVTLDAASFILGSTPRR
jgi:hypothetical protein